MNTVGVPIGGLSTVMNCIKHCVINHKTNRIIVVWGGERGLQGKRQVYPAYKKHASVKHYNREEFVKDYSNKKAQMSLTKELISCLPVKQICIEDLEGDDALYLFHSYYQKKNGGFEGIIVSNDKDFYQILSSSTVIYKPTTKTNYTIDAFQFEYQIKNPYNFAIYKAIVGDSSDNIPGIKGIGPAFVKKHFKEFFESEKEWDIKDVISYTKNLDTHNEILPRLKSILEQEQLLRNFLSIIRFDSKLQDNYFKLLNEQENNSLEFRYNSLLLLCIKNQIQSYSIEPLIEAFGVMKNQW